MNNIIFYKDRNGNEPVYDYMKELAGKNSKDSRIRLNKINDYIELLSRYGTYAGEPYVKHLQGDIWELRPLKDRILFAACLEEGYVLLHVFVKKTRKTPTREIKKAERELQDYMERRDDDE